MPSAVARAKTSVISRKRWSIASSISDRPAAHLLYCLHMVLGPGHDPHLLSADEALQAVIQNAPVSISVIDREGRLMFAAGKGLELIDMTSDTLVGSKAAELFPDQKRIPELLKKVFA